MTAAEWEDVPGALAAEKAMRARQFAAMLLITTRSGHRDPHLAADLTEDYIRAGLTADDITAARNELIDTYALDDCNPDDAIRVLREMVEPILDVPTGPGPDAEDYHRSDGDGLPL